MLAVEDAGDIESHTNKLMGQILAAVSTKSDDVPLMGRLCDMVNDVETAVMEMTSTEGQDAEFAVARLRAELDETNANLSSVRLEYNKTGKELSVLVNQHRPLPAQLADARAREADFISQREILSKECTQDLQGQRTRVDAINTDMTVLEETIEHLTRLSEIGGFPTPPPVSLLELEAALTPKCDRASLAAKTLGPVVQCENDLIVPVREKAGAISTLPPGEGMAYRKNRRCTFRIAPAEIDLLDRVELSVLALDTAADGPVVVYDGPNADPDHLIATLSGNTLPAKIRSVNFPQMTVVYSPPLSEHMAPGLMANYAAVKVPRDRSSALNECSEFNGVPIVLTGKGGFISEDSRPEFADALQNGAGTAYSAAMDCKWLIQALPGQTIRIHFTFLNTQSRNEFVDVFDGPSGDQTVLLHQSGTTVPEDVTSSSSAMFVTYGADFTIPGKGFHASWCIEGTECPTLPRPDMPPAGPRPVVVEPPHNETAPVIPPPIEAPHTVVVPPAYPMSSPELLLLEEDSGVTGIAGSQPVGDAEVDVDECGDDDSSLTLNGLATIDSDPVVTLLSQLKFELQRSLVYEHDTTNLTNRQCNRDLQELDAELQEMQQSILKLSKGMSELDISIQGLRERNTTLYTRLQTYREYAAELAQQIKARRSQSDTRSEALNAQMTALQSMRDIITQLGSHTCTKATNVASFSEQAGVLCSGELLDTQRQTDDPEECKPVCSAGCAGFSFSSAEGCRFYSSIEDHVACVSPITCSCFAK